MTIANAHLMAAELSFIHPSPAALQWWIITVSFYVGRKCLSVADKPTETGLRRGSIVEVRAASDFFALISQPLQDWVTGGSAAQG